MLLRPLWKSGEIAALESVGVDGLHVLLHNEDDCLGIGTDVNAITGVRSKEIHATNLFMVTILLGLAILMLAILLVIMLL